MQERESKAKHLQTVAGVQPTAYWFSTLLWDTLNYQIPLWITVMLMFAFKIEVFTTSEADTFSGVIALLFLFGPAAAGFSYCVSFLFKSPSLCNAVLIIFGFIIGMGGALACLVLLLLGAPIPGETEGNPKLRLAATVSSWILRFTPYFCLAKGLYFAIWIDLWRYLEEDSDLSVWSEPVLLYEVLFLLLQGIGYPILAIFIDILSSKPRTMSFVSSFVDLVTLSCFWKQRGPDITTVQEEDSDVIAEEDRVNSGSANDDLVVVSNLGKVYSNGKIAVKSLSFGIHPGEVFGLLGINGTRFAILILGGLGLRKLIISFFSILHFVQFQGREKLRLFR